MLGARKIKIGNCYVGGGARCFIIAEAGVNHNGDIKLAKKLIDIALEAGADAVKFQTFRTEEVVSNIAAKARYQQETTGAAGSQFGMLKKLELTEKDFRDLFAFARKQGIVFLSTPFDKRSVDLLDELAVPAFKIPSGEITNVPLLTHIASKNKPVILSTGMSTLSDIEEALRALREEGADDIILLHCVSSYPAEVEDINLRAIETLECAFGLPAGLSDHTVGIIVPIAAVAMGACVIEKHFTLDKSLPGPDHRVSLEPAELKQLVMAIRDVEKAMGNGIKTPAKEESKNKTVARRSLVARVDIPRGATITEEMVSIKRPGGGIEPKYINTIIGKKASHNIRRDELIIFSKLLKS